MVTLICQIPISLYDMCVNYNDEKLLTFFALLFTYYLYLYLFVDLVIRSLIYLITLLSIYLLIQLYIYLFIHLIN